MRFVPAALLAVLSLAAPSPAQQAVQPCPAPPALTSSLANNIFTPDQEVELGDVQAEIIDQRSRVIHDDEVAAHASAVAARIIAQLPPTGLKFRIFIIDLPVLNSFSLAGGRIYITRKMAAFLQSDDELAGLLGHEMGHILTHQGAIDMTRLFHDVLGVSSVTNRKDIAEKFNRLLDNAARNPKAFEKIAVQEEPQQYQADRVALFAVSAAGYSPRAFIDFFDRLAQTHGKTGNFLTDFFGPSRPDQKRLREIHKSFDTIPAACRESLLTASAPSQDFKAWQSLVVTFSGIGRRESLIGVVAKKPLAPPLRTDITRLRFSPNGDYALAQDDSSIFVLSHDPLAVLFRIDAPDAYPAEFSPDSQNIVFETKGMRVESWNIDNQEQTSIHEVAIPGGCVQTHLSHDGKLLACLNENLDISLLDVAAGTQLFYRKAYFEPKRFGALGDLLRTLVFLEEMRGTVLKMAFSPDDRYFMASGIEATIAVDTSTHETVKLSGDLADLARAGFVFLSSDRVLVKNRADAKNSAVMEFPSGKVVERLLIHPHQQLEMPSRNGCIILRPVNEARAGVLDLAAQKFLIAAKKTSAIDIREQDVLLEKATGTIALFDLATHKSKAEVEIPESPLGTVRAWGVSPDLKWLALSGTTRGAIWDLSASSRLYYTRGFRGAFFDEDRTFYGEFPKEDPQQRAIARADLSRVDISSALPLDEEAAARQYEKYLFVREVNAGKHGTTVTVKDVRDGHSLWSRNFPKELPTTTFSVGSTRVVFGWKIDTDAAKDEIKNSPSLRSRLATMQGHKGAYLIEVVDADSGKDLGQLLIDTGKGSFRLNNARAQADWVVAFDTEDRVHVYSLSSGDKVGTLSGRFALISPRGDSLLLEGEPGQVDVYSLPSLEKRAHLTFRYRVAAWSFSADANRIFVLTSNQLAYTFDAAALTQPQSATNSK